MTSYFSFIFLAAFLPVVVVLYAVAPRRTRWVVLLMASYVFFFWLSRTLILALWVSTLSIYLTGLGLGALIRQRDAAVKAVKSGKREIRARYARKMKLVLAAGLVVNFGLLAAFKYLAFFGSIIDGALGRKSLGARSVAEGVILCTGAKQPKLLPGENELLGRGVSYCGTCDGMLYRGRRVAVIAQGPEAVSEANFLAGLCREVVYFGKPEDALDPRIVVSGQKPEAILGETSVSGLRAGGEDLPFDGVFIFREAAALSALLPGLEMDGAFIRVDRRMRTNLPGVFAAGDCTGLPLQVAKAVGEGCVAAISAATA